MDIRIKLSLGIGYNFWLHLAPCLIILNTVSHHQTLHCDEKYETREQTEPKIFYLQSNPYPEITSSCYPKYFYFCERFMKSVNDFSLVSILILSRLSKLPNFKVGLTECKVLLPPTLRGPWLLSVYVCLCLLRLAQDS